MNKIYFIFLFQFGLLFSQSQDEQKLKQIYNSALTNSKCYAWLDNLSNNIGSRLSGSVGAEKAVLYTKTQLETLGLDRVYLQEVMVPHWVRGEKETAYIIMNNKKISVPVCALGGSIATPISGITAEVIEVHSLKELSDLGTEKIKGKIDFYNRPMDNSQIESMNAYRDAGDQRRSGAREASKYGAVATIVRSLTFDWMISRIPEPKVMETFQSHNIFQLQQLVQTQLSY
jgi:hypothetical protein